MKKILITIYSIIFANVFLFGQTPYKLDSNTGLPLLDLNGNPIVNDKNWNLTPIFFDDFDSEPNTFSNWYYGVGGHDQEEEFFVTVGDNFWDNIISTDNYYYSLTPQGMPNCSLYNTYPTHLLTNNNFTRTYNRDFINSSVTLQRKVESGIDAYYQPLGAMTCGSDWVKYPKTYHYSQANLFSKESFKYGFFEARFKINRPASQSKGIGQCFWLYPLGASTSYISEIDIAENDPSRDLMTSNVHYSRDYNNFWSIRKVKDWIGESSYSDIIVDQQNFHAYSCEWTPSEINFYYDNNHSMHTELHPYDTLPIYNSILKPSMLNRMNIFLDIEGEILNGKHNRFGAKIDPQVSLPFEYTIDYVKVYKLNNSTCSVIIDQPNIDFNLYVYGVKKSIKLGTNNCLNCNCIVSGGLNVSLRASDFIELNDGFEVDDNINTEFFATVNGGCAIN